MNRIYLGRPLLNFIVICSIIGYTFGLDAPDPCENAPIKPTNRERISFTMFYDANKKFTYDFLEKLCPTIETLKPAMTFQFLPGADLKKSNAGELICPSDDEKTDCTRNVAHVCASKLAPDFSKFICCAKKKSIAESTCAQQNGVNMQKYDECINGTGNNDPKKLLWDNHENLKNNLKGYEFFPVLLFDKYKIWQTMLEGTNIPYGWKYVGAGTIGKLGIEYDKCTDLAASNKWLQTVCLMFKPEFKPPAC